MLKSIIKTLGLKKQLLVRLTPDEFIIDDINSDIAKTTIRISKHPRSIIGSFFEVEKEFKAALQEVHPTRLGFIEAIICLEGQNEGGYTQIEIRAVLELAYGVGIHLAYVSESIVSNNQAKEILKNKGVGYEFIHC